MNILANKFTGIKNGLSWINYIISLLIIFVFLNNYPYLQQSYASENNPQLVSENNNAVKNIINPFDSDCYDWRGIKIPCEYKGPYSKLLFYQSNPDFRFSDNKDGTVTDNLTKLIWLKNTNCYGILDWQSAILAAKNLKDGDCSNNPDLILSDGSSPGDWRLPTMKELCTLIDYSRRDPALPIGHMFSNVPKGYHWSTTTLVDYPELAWIVYFESGTTCYENIKNRAGYFWPVRERKE